VGKIETRKSKLMLILPYSLVIILHFIIIHWLPYFYYYKENYIGVGLVTIILIIITFDFFYNNIIHITDDGIFFKPSNKIIYWHEVITPKTTDIFSDNYSFHNTALKINPRYKIEVRKRLGLVLYLLGFYTNFNFYTIRDYSLFTDVLNLKWYTYKKDKKNKDKF
jgi:hypothetical protein